MPIGAIKTVQFVRFIPFLYLFLSLSYEIQDNNHKVAVVVVEVDDNNNKKRGSQFQCISYTNYTLFMSDFSAFNSVVKLKRSALMTQNEAFMKFLNGTENFCFFPYSAKSLCMCCNLNTITQIMSSCVLI